MANIHKALLIDLLKYSRREYIYHKNNKNNYPNKQELIKFYAEKCIECRKKLKACR